MMSGGKIGKVGEGLAIFEINFKKVGKYFKLLAKINEKFAKVCIRLNKTLTELAKA